MLKVTTPQLDSLDKQACPEGPIYGGKGSFKLPQHHKAGMPVPKGITFSCKDCEYLKTVDNVHTCTDEDFIRWNGGDSKIPAPDNDPSRYCSDWFEPKHS